MNQERLSMMKPTAVVMHPGPMNRGVEIDDATADGDRSLVVRQVANGVPVRMAVIAEALEGGA
jgi:aspartate carbamoyltransferase catalytic subunit